MSTWRNRRHHRRRKRARHPRSSPSITIKRTPISSSARLSEFSGLSATVPRWNLLMVNPVFSQAGRDEGDSRRWVATCRECLPVTRATWIVCVRLDEKPAPHNSRSRCLAA